MDLEEHLSSTRDYFTYVLHRVDGFPQEDGTTLKDALHRLIDAVQLAKSETDDDARKHWLGLSLQRLDRAEVSLRGQELLEVERHLDDAKDYFENAMHGREISDELISGFDDVFAASDDEEIVQDDGQDVLSMLMERMANGMTRQETIDQLVAFGLSEEEADDREASLRQQLKKFQQQVPLVLGDLAKGETSREEAIDRLERMSMTSSDATKAVDDFLGDLNLMRSAVPKILSGVGSRASVAPAVARLEELGFSKAHATHLIRFSVDINAYRFGEIKLFGVIFTVAALLMAGAFMAFGILDPLAYVIATASVVGGAIIAVFGWQKGTTLHYDKNGLFETVRQSGRREAILQAVNTGMAAGEASALVNTTMDRLTNIYNSIFWRGLASTIICLVWFVLLSALGWYFAWYLLPVATVWSAAATWRGLVGVQLFGRR